MEGASQNLVMWITGILVAAMGAQSGWIMAMRNKAERALRDLNEYKVHVAENYVPNSVLKQVEERLTAHLLRIEGKLDIR